MRKFGFDMERKIISKLVEWKKSKNRKPLILQGARQIGKTYIVNVFADREYSNCVYLNFERGKVLSSFFDSLNPHEIVRKISEYYHVNISPDTTLLIFDEVQACPEAITSLKYFCEDAPDYHVIALGSLLGVSVNRGISSFPVGKVQFMDMFPLDFEEFLMANGEDFLISEIRKSFNSNTPLVEAFHTKALDYYKTYLYVGGLPEAVDTFIKTKNSVLVKEKLSDILDAYLNDMGKYNKQSEIPKTRIVYKNISTQLSKENTKFQYKSIKTGGRASEFESAIEWLCLAGVANQVYRLEQIMLPLNAYKSLSDFKFYMNDTGLCCASQDIMMDDIMSGNPFMNNFKGGLTENYVNTQLRARGYDLFYWTERDSAEVDFVARINGDIIPIEVKSADNVRARSLSTFMKKFSPQYSIRISAKNFGMENWIKSVPLYAVWCI